MLWAKMAGILTLCSKDGTADFPFLVISRLSFITEIAKVANFINRLNHEPVFWQNDITITRMIVSVSHNVLTLKIRDLPNDSLDLQLTLWTHMIAANQEEDREERACHVVFIVETMQNLGLSSGKEALDIARGII
jgi:hypothetical protein